MASTPVDIRLDSAARPSASLAPPMPLNVAIIQSFLPSGSPHGGVGLQAHQLANELISRGHRVCIFSRDPAPGDARYEHRHLPSPAALKTRLMRAAEGHCFPLRVAFEDFRGFDVVHAHGDNAWLPTSRRAPLVRTFHGSAADEAWFALVGPTHLGLKQLYWAGQQLSYYPLEWLGGLRAEVTVGISEGTRKRLPFVEFIVGEAVNIERFARPADAARESRPTILFVGSLAGRKRGSMLVDIFRREVLPAVPDAQLWMICERTGDDGAVRYLGRRPNAELPELFHRAHVFCLPSSYEGFGIPYIEAMAAGLPVVATHNPGADEVLEEGRSGVLTGDDTLGGALVELLRSPQRREALIERGPARAAQFSLRAVADEYERLYELARSRARAKGGRAS